MTTRNTLWISGVACCAAVVGMSSEAYADCTGSGTAWMCAAGSTPAQVQAAIDAADDDATLTFAAGSYDWTGARISLNDIDGVTLVCESVGACEVTHDGDLITKDNLTTPSNRLHRVSGFRFTGTSGTATIWLAVQEDLTSIRIDHNTFTETSEGGCRIAVMLGAVDPGYDGNIHGVVDHNTFTSTSSGNHMGVKNLAGQDAAWQVGLPGSSRNLFIEDNTFTYAATSYDPGCGCLDAWNGGPTVVRYNTTNNCRIVSHGVCHGGPPNFEVYRNTIATPDGYRHIHHQGSGEMFVFDNDLTNGDEIALLHYRSCPSADTGCELPRCDGTQPEDGNRQPIGTYYGYPCYRQPGRDGAGTLRPIFAWNNAGDGGKSDIDNQNAWGCSSPSPADHVMENRDYYNAVSASPQTSSTSPFDGTTGMGFGTQANRPTTCTTNTEPDDAGDGGVGYWATDVGDWNRVAGEAQGTLYMCTAANTWTPYYTPYRYPHPLVAPEACDSVTACTADDGCCPAGCTGASDGDCAAVPGEEGGGCCSSSDRPAAALTGFGLFVLGTLARRRARRRAA